jgi:hypothetical protein
VKFPSSTRRLRPLLGALRASPGLRPLPNTPLSSARIGRSPPPCPSCQCRLSSSGALGPGLDAVTDLADQAAQAGVPGLSRAAFILGALQELSVAFCWGNVSMCRSGAYVAMRASGRSLIRGLAGPQLN